MGGMFWLTQIIVVLLAKSAVNSKVVGDIQYMIDLLSSTIHNPQSSAWLVFQVLSQPSPPLL